MGDWPKVAAARGETEAIGIWSDLCIGAMMNGAITGSGTGTAWPSANRAVFVPFRLDRLVVVTQAVVGCGTTGGGNFDVGVYDQIGNKIVSSGATARTSSTYVVANITDTAIGPGTYYMALAADGTNNYSAIAPANAALCQALGMKQAATSYTLPSTVTYASVSSAFIPNFSLLVTSK